MNQQEAKQELETILNQVAAKPLDEHKTNRNRMNQSEKVAAQVFENWLGMGISDLFDDLTTQLDRVPTQWEYLEKGANIAWENWKNYVPQVLKGKEKYKGKVITFGSTGADFAYSEAVMRTLVWRICRAYKSYLLEHVLFLQLKHLYPSAILIRDTLVDIIFGADMVLIDEQGYTFYIHLTKNSQIALDAIKRKESSSYFYNPDPAGSKWTRYKRDFSNHVTLAYDTFESDRTTIFNGLPVFKPDWLKSELEDFKETHKDLMDKVQQGELPSRLKAFVKEMKKQGRYTEDFSLVLE